MSDRTTTIESMQAENAALRAKIESLLKYQAVLGEVKRFCEHKPTCRTAREVLQRIEKHRL